MTDELDTRRQRLESLSAAGGPLASRSPEATVSNPEWYGADGRPTPARVELHQRLVDEYRAEAPNVPAGRQAVVIVGPPGAGKSGVRDDIMRDTGTGPDQWRHIDPDAFRDRLADTMNRDGSIARVVPPEAAALRPAPRELSSQLFVESAKLATSAQNEAVDRGENVMIEGAYSDPKRLDALVKGLEKKGYDVHLAAVDVSQPDALARTQERYRADALKAMEPGAQGHDALGGRFVPAESLAGHFDEQGNARATAAAQQVAADRPGVQSLRQYTVSAADRPAVLTSVAERQGGMQPVDAEVYRAARAAGMAEAMPTGSRPQPGVGPQQRSAGADQQRPGQGPAAGQDQGARPQHLNRGQQPGRGDQRGR
jgi:predicted ABC-type ATPase